MIIVHYDAINGKAVPDGAVALYVDAALETAYELNPNEPTTYLLVGSEHLVHEFRLRIVRGQVSHEHIIFKFIGEDGQNYEIKANEYARLAEWPRDFCDHTQKILMEIGRTRRRTDKENTNG